MKKTTLFSLAVLLAACGGANKQRIEIDAGVEMVEANKGHKMVSYTINHQRDSAGLVIIDYTAIIDSSQTSTGHIVFGKTGDDILSPM